VYSPIPTFLWTTALSAICRDCVILGLGWF
jgi:hypothetical protein